MAVFSHPSNDAVLTNVFPGKATDSVELGRFVLLDSVAGNGETWFLGRCFELLRGIGLRGVVSFSDPLPRSTWDGQTIFPGHVGTIYQAHNGVYKGRSTPNTLYLLPNGRTFSARAQQKIRAREQGWRYSADQLIVAGALIGVTVPPLTEAEDSTSWLQRWRPTVTRRMKHDGNHRYAWKLANRRYFKLKPDGPYPKSQDTHPGQQLRMALA
jgi:hypothetical protein